jgi:3-oxoacyl-[acyl-carrier protein] reductase
MRRVVVTGASSGIGLACAKAFLAAGDTVVAHCRTGRAVVEELRTEHGANRVVPVAADLSREEGCVALVRAAGAFGVLVHSAGIWNDGEIRTLTAENLEKMFRTNTFSAYFLAREAARVIKQGSMIFIGSTAGERGEPGHSHYAGSKAALWGLVQSLAQELAPDVRVNRSGASRSPRTWPPRWSFSRTTVSVTLPVWICRSPAAPCCRCREGDCVRLLAESNSLEAGNQYGRE